MQGSNARKCFCVTKHKRKIASRAMGKRRVSRGQGIEQESIGELDSGEREIAQGPKEGMLYDEHASPLPAIKKGFLRRECNKDNF